MLPFCFLQTLRSLVIIFNVAINRSFLFLIYRGATIPRPLHRLCHHSFPSGSARFLSSPFFFHQLFWLMSILYIRYIYTFWYIISLVIDCELEQNEIVFRYRLNMMTTRIYIYNRYKKNRPIFWCILYKPPLWLSWWLYICSLWVVSCVTCPSLHLPQALLFKGWQMNFQIKGEIYNTQIFNDLRRWRDKSNI